MTMIGQQERPHGLFRVALLLAATLSLVGCETVPLGSYLSYKDQIHEIAEAKSLAHVNLIENSGSSFNPDATLQTEQNVSKAVQEVLGPRFQITSEETQDTPPGLDAGLNQLFGALGQTKDLSVVSRIPVLEDYMAKHDQRYFLFTYVAGFARSGANEAGAVVTGILIGIVTLGLVVPVPISARSDFYVCVVDKAANEVIYYRDSAAEGDPKDYNTIRDQVRDTLKELVKL